MPDPLVHAREAITWHVWVCPYCGRQYHGPGGHEVAGDSSATSCFHAHEGERGVVQPRLVKLSVVAAEPFALREIPHDVPPTLAGPEEILLCKWCSRASAVGAHGNNVCNRTDGLTAR